MTQNLQSHSLQITQQQKISIFYGHQFVHEAITSLSWTIKFLPSSLLKRGLLQEIINIEQKLYSYLKIHFLFHLALTM